MSTAIPPDYRGWWRIVDTGAWANEGLDILGPALLSLTGDDDRLRMHCLLAYVKARSTKTGVSFTWRGAWEFDQLSGTGTARVREDGRLYGKLKIKDGDDSTFEAQRTDEPRRIHPRPAILSRQVASSKVEASGRDGRAGAIQRDQVIGEAI